MTTIKGMIKESNKGTIIVARNHNYQVLISGTDRIFMTVNEKAYGYAQCNVVIKETAINAETGKFTEVRYKRNADIIIESPNSRDLELYIPVRGFSVQGKEECNYTIDSEMLKIKLTNFKAGTAEIIRLYNNVFYNSNKIADALAQVED